MTVIVAVVRGHDVENVVVADALADFWTPAWRATFAGASLIAVPDGVPCSPGWSYDPLATPPFAQPAPPAVEPDAATDTTRSA